MGKHCLSAVGLLDPYNDRRYRVSSNGKRIVIPSWSSLDGQRTHSTDFALLLKRHPFFKQFIVYPANEYDKKESDPKFTNRRRTCRGELKRPMRKRWSKKAVPQSWRYHFKRHAKRCSIMVQLLEWSYAEHKYILGNDHVIETETVKKAGIKI